MTAAIVAHRGDSGNAPENTLSAFRRAVELSIEYVELDYHLSSDSQMVVIHDGVLDRTTDAASRAGFGPGVNVRDRSWAALQELDAAAWPSGRWRHFRPLRIPSLEQALDEIVVRGGCQCIVERKPRDAAPEPLCELIRRMGIEDKVVVTSYAAEPDAWDFLDRCLDILPGVRVAYQIAGDFYRAPAAARHGQLVDCEHAMLSEQLISEFHRHDLRVFAWTANDEVDIRRLGRIGVEGITTDYPERALTLLP